MTPVHVSQYFGNKNASLKLGCNTLFLLNVFSHLTIGVILSDYTQLSLYRAMKLFPTLGGFYSRIAINN